MTMNGTVSLHKYCLLKYFHVGENVARGGQVAQSSIGWQGNPERAIDGNRASHWSHGSCTHTMKDANPWWRVDLQKTYKVHSVKITNRKDCCSERINRAEIRIGNSLKDNGNGNPMYALIACFAGIGPEGNRDNIFKTDIGLQHALYYSYFDSDTMFCVLQQHL